MKFRFQYMSLTQIGEVFGTTSHQVGRWLAKIGLRTEGKQGLKPSREAYAGGYVMDVPSRNQGYIWAWHTEKTVKALEDAGHKVAIQPGNALLLPCKLSGPFQHRANPQFGYEIVNADGSVAVLVTGEENARFVCQLLNLAEKHGVVARLLGADSDDGVDVSVASPATGGMVG